MTDSSNHLTSLADAVSSIGGPIAAAKVCGVSRQAVDRWLAKGRLPRTEYTGETRYAEALAAVPGAGFAADDLLKVGVKANKAA